LSQFFAAGFVEKTLAQPTRVPEMVKSWSSWKPFPDARSGEHIEAPIGPGVYEVRHTMTGQLIAFGHSANVANAICDLHPANAGGSWMRIFHRTAATPRVSDMEYRTCAAASRAEAKTTAHRLMGLRQNFWRNRTAHGWVGGSAA
jgi:hypothetical protein